MGQTVPLTNVLKNLEETGGSGAQVQTAALGSELWLRLGPGIARSSETRLVHKNKLKRCTSEIQWVNLYQIFVLIKPKSNL